MNSVKILHCADFHIGAAEHFLGTAAGQRQIETLMTFEKTVDLAKERGVQVIAIAGDLFDSNRAGAQWAKAVLEKIASVPEIQVVFAAGNHDPFNAESPFKTEELPPQMPRRTRRTARPDPSAPASLFLPLSFLFDPAHRQKKTRNKTSRQIRRRVNR